MTDTQVVATVRAYKTLEDCERDIVAYQYAYEAAAQAFLEIDERRLYLARGYNTFEEYVLDNWPISPSRASQLKAAGEFVRYISVHDNALPVPASDAHVRPLMSIRPTPEDRPEAVWTRRALAWRMVVEHAAKTGEKITLNLVRSVVMAQFKGGTKVKPPKVPEGLRLSDLTAAFEDIADCGITPEEAVEKFGGVHEWEWFDEAYYWMSSAKEAGE